jgi:hypothetical protein
LSDDEIASLPIDRVAMLVLCHLVEMNQGNQHNFLMSAAQLKLSESTQRI